MEMQIRLSMLKALSALSLLVCASICAAQIPRLETKNGHQFATVVFTRAFGRTRPRYYSIALDSAGDAAYEYVPSSDQQSGAPYRVDFHASAALHDKVFHITEQLKFFKIPDSEIRSAPSSENLAILENQPIETLAFREGSVDNEITYHQSRNPLIQQLTKIFEDLYNTLDFGRRLSDLHQNRNPELATELKRMQQMSEHGQLEELSAVAPILQSIASDPKEDKDVRDRAEAITK